MLDRLERTIARAGVASRRGAAELIRAGRVRVGGRLVTELGVRVDPRTERIEVDGRVLVSERLVYLVLHKPRGVVSTVHDPEGRPTVLDRLQGVNARVVPVGRLDFNTSGVLLLTNDGDFSQVLSLPSTHAAKVYVAKVAGEVTDRDLERWSQSIVIEGRPTQPAQAKRLRTVGGKTWLEITLREGRNRQVHRIAEAAGFRLMRLVRVSFAGITADGLRPGEHRHLTTEELVRLQRAYGVPKRIHRRSASGPLERGPRPRAQKRRRTAPELDTGKLRGKRAATRPRVAAEQGGKGGPKRGVEKQHGKRAVLAGSGAPRGKLAGRQSARAPTKAGLRRG